VAVIVAAAGVWDLALEIVGKFDKDLSAQVRSKLSAT